MDLQGHPRAQDNAVQSYVRTAHLPCDTPDALAKLATALGPEPLAAVLLFLSPNADAQALAHAAESRFAPALVVGCTTAGELTSQGYSEGKIVAVGLPQAYFRTALLEIEDLSSYDSQTLIDQMIQNRHQLARQEPDWPSEFNFLMIDGLSRREDALTADLALGLGPVPLFGGSAGDGVRFERALVLMRGKARENAALVLQVRSLCPIKVFKSDHLQPSERKMVVTGAHPDRRLVHEINAAPAAREYARLLGKDPEQLDQFTFAAHPVVVRIGDQHHVRSIQRVAENGDLVFFSAIDEGLVLTLAEPMDMVSHLQGEVDALCAQGVPDTILACDCLLRKLEAEQKQLTGKLSDILARNRVVGFSTYGEQVNSMHVNQTLTGVAIYPPLPQSRTRP